MLVVALLCAVAARATPARGDGGVARPNIVLIVADDLGWNDVGFHGSNQIPTPNIDALAYSGLILHNYYVTPICTPSRSALMTGKYPIHTGMQHNVIYGTEPRGLPLSEKILPQYLKGLGYKTHLIGKWHLGHYKKEYLPLNRGFDSHMGFWTGRIDMYDHTAMEPGDAWGFDMRRGFKPADDVFGKYATDIYTEEAVKVIKAHNRTKPIFLMVCHSAVHSGNPYEPVRAPDKLVANFSYIKRPQRQKFAAVLTKLDESVGRVVSELQKQGLLNNSIIVFTTDNGGPAAGFNDNAASNYPLRGVKNTLWEGGIRGAGLLWSGAGASRSRVTSQLMHITDWLPTLYAAAGGNVSDIGKIDGVDQWAALSNNEESRRNMVLHNIDDEWGIASLTIGRWKLIKGTTYKGAWDSWYGPGGREGSYDVEKVINHPAGQAMKELNLMPDKEKILQLRANATVKCAGAGAKPQACAPLRAPCLFDVHSDPCERNNLADTEPQVVQELLIELENINRTAVPPNNKKLDPRGNPTYWGRYFTNFGDYNFTRDCHQPV